MQGFRGVGPPASLPITTGPGLTLVVGRNGSGKSSFAEALELLLTGDNSRWSTRSAIWKEGWRNLHQSDTRIDAEFVVEGAKGTTVVSREWKPDAKLEEADTVVSAQGSKKSDLETMGWAGAVEMYRPFLSYSELGSMLDAGPSALYDALSAILGLEDLIEAEARLKEASKQRKKLSDEAKLALPPILERLATVEDERASVCIEALSAKTWDLDAVEKAVIGTEAADREESQLAVLRQLAVLEAPDADEVKTAADGLQAAASALREMGGTEAAKALQTAELLGAALTFHERHGDQDCPVCGQGALNAEWRTATEEEIGRLRQLAEQVDLAHRLMEESMKSARAHLLPVPAVLSSASEIGLEVEDVIGAWKTWSAGASIEESEALAQHLHASLPSVAEGVEKLKATASTRTSAKGRRLASDSNRSRGMARHREASPERGGRAEGRECRREVDPRCLQRHTQRAFRSHRRSGSGRLGHATDAKQRTAEEDRPHRCRIGAKGRPRGERRRDGGGRARGHESG